MDGSISRLQHDFALTYYSCTSKIFAERDHTIIYVQHAQPFIHIMLDYIIIIMYTIISPWACDGLFIHLGKIRLIKYNITQASSTSPHWGMLTVAWGRGRSLIVTMLYVLYAIYNVWWWFVKTVVKYEDQLSQSYLPFSNGATLDLNSVRVYVQYNMYLLDKNNGSSVWCIGVELTRGYRIIVGRDRVSLKTW